MKMKRVALAVFTMALLVFGIASGASAAVVDFGTRDVTSTGTDAFGSFQVHTLAETQPFTDEFDFAVNNGARATFEFQVNNSQGRLIDVTTASAGVFTAELLADTLPIGTGVFATQNVPNGTTFTLAYADLVVGVDYTLRVIGNVLSSAGGTYTFSANLSQVPLPAAVWLFLSALIGLATATGIGRKQARAA